MAVHPPAVVLLTRPRAASARLAADLARGGLPAGTDLRICPLMEIVGTGARVDLAGIAGLILTSQNAVSYLTATAAVPPRPGLPAHCVGPRTAAAARATGLDAHLAGPDAEALVASLLEARPPTPLLHIHGTHLRGDIATRLSAAGLPTRGIAVYDQRPVPPGPDFREALRAPRLIVPLFSPRSAGLFAEAAGPEGRHAAFLALSPAVADALPAAWRAGVRVLARPDGAEMVREILRAARAAD